MTGQVCSLACDVTLQYGNFGGLTNDNLSEHTSSFFLPSYQPRQQWNKKTLSINQRHA